MKTFGVDSMFLDSPKYQGGFEQSWHDAVDRAVGPYARTPEDERPEDFETPDGYALTECEHGIPIDSPSPCKVCGAQ